MHVQIEVICPLGVPLNWFLVVSVCSRHQKACLLPGNKMLQVHQQSAEEARILLAEDSIRDRNVGAGTHLSTDGGKSDTPSALRLLAAVAEPERYVIFF